MKKVAIIGAGAVGASTAFYLSQDDNLDVTVFDDGKGQATKAAAGIISPWFSKRRNKAWYRMARLGADFYQTLIEDLSNAGADSSFYQQTGVYLLKKKEEKLQELYDLALSRRQESPLIGDLAILDRVEAGNHFPGLEGFDKLLFSAGGARVDGAQLTASLLQASSARVIRKKVGLEVDGTSYLVDGQVFDYVILTCGAWLKELLSPLGYVVDVRPQKGQLRDYYFDDLTTDAFPVVMPEGELDLIPFNAGKISMGATHENDMGFDLTVDEDLLDALEEEALAYFPKLKEANTVSERVGIRAYTSDFSPFYGQVPNLVNVYAASGLGSTGLTVGPLLGHELAQTLLGGRLLLNADDYPIKNYLKSGQ